MTPSTGTMIAMDAFLLVLRCVLAATFLFASAGKLLDLPGSRQALVSFGASAKAATRLGNLLPAFELLLGILLLIDSTVRIGAGLAIAQLLIFTWLIGKELRAGRAPVCYCFGQVSDEPVSKKTIVRNVSLIVASAVLLILGAGASASLTGMPSWLVTALLALIFVLGCLITLPFVLARKAILEQRAEVNEIVVLEKGSLAPDVQLTGIDGKSLTLKESIVPGIPSALVFASPGCGHCVELLPRLMKWQGTLSDSINVVIAQVVEPDKLQETVDQYTTPETPGLMWAVDAEAMQRYGVAGTPSALMIDSDNKVESPVAVGAEAIEVLLRNTIRLQRGRRLTRSL